VEEAGIGLSPSAVKAETAAVAVPKGML